MASSGCTFDLTSFRAGLRAKLKVTQKTAAEVINQAAGSALANAIRLTKKTTRARIASELQRDGLALKLVQSPRFQGRLPGRLRGFAGRRHTKAQVAEAARQLIQARQISSGAAAAGFFPALTVFRPASARRASAKGLPGQGSAKRATESNLTATFTNCARGASAVAGAALQQALNEEGRAMKSYAEKKLAQAWK